MNLSKENEKAYLLVLLNHIRQKIEIRAHLPYTELKREAQRALCPIKTPDGMLAFVLSVTHSH
jgi:hypothetical protein